MADLKRVFYVKYLAHNNFIDILGTRSDIRLDKLENDSPDDAAAPVLAGAHAFQIGSARDELAKKYHADRDLLRRTQSLLIVSTNGAGYDTVNLNACTDAGVLVVNQAGGNKEAVAEHALAMMLSLTKKIVESDRAMRREKDLNRTLYIGHDIRHRTVGIVGLGNVGKRLAELCRGLFSMRVLVLRPLCIGRCDEGERRREGRARRADAASGFRVGQLSAHRRDARHGRREAVRADEAECLFRHDRARQHP